MALKEVERLACPSNVSLDMGRLKETELTGHGRPKDVMDVVLVRHLSVRQWRRTKLSLARA